MAKDRIETGKSAPIEVTRCSGDLVVRPWMELAVQAEGDYRIVEQEGRHVFEATGDLRLLVPTDAALTIGNVHGDALIRGVRGSVKLDAVSGDIVLQNIAGADLAAVHGDLVAKNLEGSLTVGTVYGDALIRNANGMLHVENVYGDLAAYYVNGDLHLGLCKGDINLRTINGQVTIDSGYRDVNLRNLGGLCSVRDIHGDIRLKGGLSAGEHFFGALGDIVVRWPVDAPLQLVAKAPDIRNRLPLINIKEIEGSLIGNIGDGDTVVTLEANGRINLKEGRLTDEKWESEQSEAFDMDFMMDFSGLGERISAEVSQSMTSLTKDLEKSFGPEFAENISVKVSQQAEKAARKAEAAAEKARKYAERQAARAQRYQARAPYTPPTPPAPPEKPQSRVSTDEQLKILRMVERGTISPDEAATLLEALE